MPDTPTLRGEPPPKPARICCIVVRHSDKRLIVILIGCVYSHKSRSPTNFSQSTSSRLFAISSPSTSAKSTKAGQPMSVNRMVFSDAGSNLTFIVEREGEEHTETEIDLIWVPYVLLFIALVSLAVCSFLRFHVARRQRIAHRQVVEMTIGSGRRRSRIGLQPSIKIDHHSPSPELYFRNEQADDISSRSLSRSPELRQLLRDERHGYHSTTGQRYFPLNKDDLIAANVRARSDSLSDSGGGFRTAQNESPASAARNSIQPHSSFTTTTTDEYVTIESESEYSVHTESSTLRPTSPRYASRHGYTSGADSSGGTLRDISTDSLLSSGDSQRRLPREQQILSFTSPISPFYDRHIQQSHIMSTSSPQMHRRRYTPKRLASAKYNLSDSEAYKSQYAPFSPLQLPTSKPSYGLPQSPLPRATLPPFATPPFAPNESFTNYDNLSASLPPRQVALDAFQNQNVQHIRREMVQRQRVAPSGYLSEQDTHEALAERVRADYLAFYGHPPQLPIIKQQDIDETTSFTTADEYLPQFNPYDSPYVISTFPKQARSSVLANPLYTIERGYPMTSSFPNERHPTYETRPPRHRSNRGDVVPMSKRNGRLPTDRQHEPRGNERTRHYTGQSTPSPRRDETTYRTKPEMNHLPPPKTVPRSQILSPATDPTQMLSSSTTTSNESNTIDGGGAQKRPSLKKRGSKAPSALNLQVEFDSRIEDIPAPPTPPRQVSVDHPALPQIVGPLGTTPAKLTPEEAALSDEEERRYEDKERSSAAAALESSQAKTPDLVPTVQRRTKDEVAQSDLRRARLSVEDELWYKRPEQTQNFHPALLRRIGSLREPTRLGHVQHTPLPGVTRHGSLIRRAPLQTPNHAEEGSSMSSSVETPVTKTSAYPNQMSQPPSRSASMRGDQRTRNRSDGGIASPLTTHHYRSGPNKRSKDKTSAAETPIHNHPISPGVDAIRPSRLAKARAIGEGGIAMASVPRSQTLTSPAGGAVPSRGFSMKMKIGRPNTGATGNRRASEAAVRSTSQKKLNPMARIQESDSRKPSSFALDFI